MHVAGRGYRRNQEESHIVLDPVFIGDGSEGPHPILSETFEPETTSPGSYPTPEGWWGPPYQAPTPPIAPELEARRDLYVWIATGVLVIGVIGGGILIAKQRKSKRRARR